MTPTEIHLEEVANAVNRLTQMLALTIPGDRRPGDGTANLADKIDVLVEEAWFAIDQDRDGSEGPCPRCARRASRLPTGPDESPGSGQRTEL